jgi:Mg/Co/Ni transporter MgtE
MLAGTIVCNASTLQAKASNQTLKNADTRAQNITSKNLNSPNESRKLNYGLSKLSPQELGPIVLGLGSLTNPQIVEKVLTTLAPDEIKKYPLTSLPQDELVTVLENISIQTLEKTLDNIPTSDLMQIFSKLPQDKSQEILDRLPQEKSQEILDRLTSQSLK